MNYVKMQVSPVMVNRNGELKLVIMTKDIFNEYFRIRKPNGKIDIEKEYFHVKNNDYYLEVILINELKKARSSCV